MNRNKWEEDIQYSAGGKVKKKQQEGGKPKPLAEPPKEVKQSLKDNISNGSWRADSCAIKWEVLPYKKKYHIRKRGRYDF